MLILQYSYIIYTMVQGIERFPTSAIESREPNTEFERNAKLTYEIVVKHANWIIDYLNLDAKRPFVANSKALKKRDEQLAESRRGSYALNRGMQQISILLAATVKQMECEFGRKMTLDIGCGMGRLGAELARKAKSKVTFLDNDPEALAKVSPKSGAKVLGEAAVLSAFEDESFERTIAAYSSLSWTSNPLQAVKAVNEQMRVTDVGGSAFFIPVLSNVAQRQGIGDYTEKNPSTRLGLGGESIAFKVWALQDYLVLDSLQRFEEEGLCSTSWCAYIGQGQSTGLTIESFSAIVDKHKSIPDDVFEANLDYVKLFVEHA